MLVLHVLSNGEAEPAIQPAWVRGADLCGPCTLVTLCGTECGLGVGRLVLCLGVGRLVVCVSMAHGLTALWRGDAIFNRSFDETPPHPHLPSECYRYSCIYL